MLREHSRYKTGFIPIKKSFLWHIFYKCPALTLYRCSWQIIQARKFKNIKNLILIYPFHTSEFLNSSCKCWYSVWPYFLLLSIENWEFKCQYKLFYQYANALEITNSKVFYFTDMSALSKILKYVICSYFWFTVLW